MRSIKVNFKENMQGPFMQLCYMVICKAPLTGGYSEALSA